MPDALSAPQMWTAYNDAFNYGDHDRAVRYLAADPRVLLNGQPVIGSAEDRLIQEELLRCYPDYHRVYANSVLDGDIVAERTPATRPHA
jgi:hypothetical protein